VREAAPDKARRYLGEGRLIVTRVIGNTIDATCRGDGQTYTLGRNAKRGWHCTCPNLTANCSHLIALRSVTSIKEG
jgi:uncharacterized Zn finger protein